MVEEDLVGRAASLLEQCGQPELLKDLKSRDSAKAKELAE